MNFSYIASKQKLAILLLSGIVAACIPAVYASWILNARDSNDLHRLEKSLNLLIINLEYVEGNATNPDQIHDVAGKGYFLSHDGAIQIRVISDLKNLKVKIIFSEGMKKELSPSGRSQYLKLQTLLKETYDKNGLIQTRFPDR